MFCNGKIKTKLQQVFDILVFLKTGIREAVLSVAHAAVNSARHDNIRANISKKIKE